MKSASILVLNLIAIHRYAGSDFCLGYDRDMII